MTEEALIKIDLDYDEFIKLDQKRHKLRITWKEVLHRGLGIKYE